MSVIKGVFSLRYVVAVWSGLLLLTLCLRPVASEPGWVVVNLHPDPWWESSAYAVSGSYQGGSVYDGGMSVLTQPAVWNGTADVVILGSARIGQVLGMAGADKVGFYGGRAALWKGPSSEYVELWPDFSIAYAAWNGWQAGSVSAGPAQASLWHGSADSRVALHPGGALSSVALAVDASGQAGNVHWAQEGGSHAALWQSTAESVVDLHPEGAYASRAQAISNGRQGGGCSSIEMASHMRLSGPGQPTASLISPPPEARRSVVASSVWTATSRWAVRAS